jgi:hypothetical protein
VVAITDGFSAGLLGAAGIALAGALLSGVLIKAQPTAAPTEPAERVNA